MRSYFRPWRRKIGLVTLVLACTIAHWWLRSCWVCDVICMRERNRFLNTYLFDIVPLFDSDFVNVFASDRSSIHWLRRRDKNPYEPFHAVYAAGGDVLDRMTIQADVSNPAMVQIPYAAIVVPLMLASAWLLFSRPQEKKKPDAR